MKTALIFPGQGSQYIGMGYDFYSKYDASRDIFNRCNLAIDRDLSELIFMGVENDLSKTQNSQPAIMTVSIAIFEALKYEKLLKNDMFACVAGHSLGEYSALVANGSLKFEESVKLLKVRSKAMQDSMPLGTGGMIALIGFEEEAISNALVSAKKFGEIFVANDNSKGQVVLSGEMNAIEYIASNSKDLNIKKAIKLPVSAPFHCRLINSAAEVMSKELTKYTFKPFNAPLYSNVNAKVCNEKEISELLIKQIVSIVKWREIVENMINDGIENFIEIGPGNVLTNLVKRISKEVTATSISKVEDFEKLDKLDL